MTNARYYIEPGPPVDLFFRVGEGKPKRICGIDANPAWKNRAAFEILKHALQDDDRARSLATRFAWRAMEDWRINQQRGISEQNVRSIVDQIERVWAETAPMRRIVEREKFVPDSDRLAPGMGGNTPFFKPNPPKRDK